MRIEYDFITRIAEPAQRLRAAMEAAFLLGFQWEAMVECIRADIRRKIVQRLLDEGGVQI